MLSLTSYRKQVFLILHDNVIQDERVAVSGVRVVGFPEQRFASDALGVGELRPGKGACYSLAPALAGILETVAASNRVADKVDHEDQMARRGGIESARGLVIAREIRPRLLEAGEHVVEHGARADKPGRRERQAAQRGKGTLGHDDLGRLRESRALKAQPRRTLRLFRALQQEFPVECLVCRRDARK